MVWKLETKTMPSVQPRVEPAPVKSPGVDPDRRLNPDRLCPAQKTEIVRKISDV